MDRVVLIKYGELTTKKGNRKFFINTLYQNLKKKLNNLDVKISRDISRMYIEFSDNDLELVLKKLNQVFGIHTYQVAYKIETDSEAIKNLAVTIMENKTGTFKVETKRANKNFPIQSIEFSRQLGGLILKNNDKLTVDVHNPDTTLMIEILDRYTYLYTDKYYGLGGYPVGTQPRGMLMLSGGIDSPVAGYLALKRGVKIDAVYFEAIPHTSLEARNKVIDLSKKLCQYTDQIRLHIVPFTNIQEAIYKECNPEYCITIMRRMMYRIMEKLAKRNKGLVIINGESIGQVASQTLTSMSVINSVTNMPVIRPVACLDKLEIIDIAKKIDTYDISILPFEDCCTIFVPKHPVINPNLQECLINEEKFDYNKMIEDTVNNVMTITITENMEKEFNDLL
ncbi:MAG: tRNA 4-thiouridine(8) synthase ThiI [Tenericutes bacterium]|nr:tRNA 4-thiouridine(8) synthase ThiI [Mycoplasmatota bacterium]